MNDKPYLLMTEQEKADLAAPGPKPGLLEASLYTVMQNNEELRKELHRLKGIINLLEDIIKLDNEGNTSQPH